MITSATTEVVRAVMSVDVHPLDRGEAAAKLTMGQRQALFSPACACGKNHWSAGVNLARVHTLAASVKQAIRELSEPPALRALVQIAGIRDGEKQLLALRAYLFGGAKAVRGHLLAMRKAA